MIDSKMETYKIFRAWRDCLIIWTVSMMTIIVVDAVMRYL